MITYSIDIYNYGSDSTREFTRHIPSTVHAGSRYLQVNSDMLN